MAALWWKQRRGVAVGRIGTEVCEWRLWDSSQPKTQSAFAVDAQLTVCLLKGLANIILT